MTGNLSEHLACDAGFQPRRKLQRLCDRLAGPLAKPLSKGIWAGGFKHLRHFDHGYTFERSRDGLTAMRRDGRVIAGSVPVARLLRMDRPVTLVTTGPSALEYDWASLRNSGRMIVAVTGGTAFLKERGITPDLLVVSDPDFCKTNGFHVRDAAGIPLVIEYRSAAAIDRYFPGGLSDRPLAIIERVNKWYGIPSVSEARLKEMNARSGSPFVLPEANDKLGRIGWSDRLDLGFFPSSTVAFVALQAIVACGATDVEIVGMDLGGDSSVYANALPSKLREQYEVAILPAFRMMQKALENRGVVIKNLSRVCPLPPEIFSPNTH